MSLRFVRRVVGIMLYCPPLLLMVFVLYPGDPFSRRSLPNRLFLCSYVQQCCLSRLSGGICSLGVEANLSAGGSLFYNMYVLSLEIYLPCEDGSDTIIRFKPVTFLGLPPAAIIIQLYMSWSSFVFIQLFEVRVIHVIQVQKPNALSLI